MTGKDADKERDDSFHDERVALCLKHHVARLVERGGEPHAALATIDEITLVFLLLGKRLLLAAYVNQQLIAVHPVVIVLKFLHYLLLQFFNTHV